LIFDNAAILDDTAESEESFGLALDTVELLLHVMGAFFIQIKAFELDLFVAFRHLNVIQGDMTQLVLLQYILGGRIGYPSSRNGSLA